MSRRQYFWTAYFAAFLLIALMIVPMTPRLIWNASASVPVGFYTLRSTMRPVAGDLVAVRPPTALARFMAERHYLPLDTPLLKRVAGRSGQTVCRTGRTIRVDGAVFGKALDRDSRGRPLPVWQGCRRIAADQLFLMNVGVPDSLDGRYFGPLPASTVIGKATPLWTDETGRGRFVWHAPTR